MRNANLVHSSSHFCPSSTAPRGAATFYRPKTEKRPRCLSQIDHIIMCEPEWKVQIKCTELKSLLVPLNKEVHRVPSRMITVLYCSYWIPVQDSSPEVRDAGESRLLQSQVRRDAKETEWPNCDKIVYWKRTGKSPKSQEETQAKVPDLTDHQIFPALNPLFDPKEHSVSLTTVEENSKEQPKILTTVKTFGIQKQPQIGIQLNPLRGTVSKPMDRRCVNTPWATRASWLLGEGWHRSMDFGCRLKVCTLFCLLFFSFKLQLREHFLMFRSEISCILEQRQQLFFVSRQF